MRGIFRSEHALPGSLAPNSTNRSGTLVDHPANKQQNLMAVATRLRRKLRSHPTFAKTTRRRGQRSGTPYIREYQKGLVVINYPGPSPPGVMKVFECDKIVDGSIHYSGDMTEDEIRQGVARIIRKKQLKEYKFNDVSSEDFVFVKCFKQSSRY